METSYQQQTLSCLFERVLLMYIDRDLAVPRNSFVLDLSLKVNA
ncbi:hypothetical protein ADIS_1137 [Lunatimonas lonarensis]|uniref:Uncharacterized protein n=1 Tax=Lunatimonas lonarensis TaxID=1232681 RepID=R7ZWA1_9BACT|nr:hypothetical protein ADIS_1137 [Lunatimonas lonarensis]